MVVFYVHFWSESLYWILQWNGMTWLVVFTINNNNLLFVVYQRQQCSPLMRHRLVFWTTFKTRVAAEAHRRCTQLLQTQAATTTLIKKTLKVAHSPTLSLFFIYIKMKYEMQVIRKHPTQLPDVIENAK